jgi:glycosyltransferase involved in cell wall biosynthesis
MEVSVLVPCKNAMPWLPLAVRAPLLQLGLLAEVIVVDDWSTDGSGQWLDDLSRALGPARATIERKGEPEPASTNLAITIPRRQTSATPSFGADAAPAATNASEAPAADGAASAEAIAAEILASESRCCLRVLSNRGHGQGAALQTAFDAARAPLIAHIEADDEYGARRLELMRQALLAQPSADAVFSATELTGTNVTGGMRSYISWQNELLTSEALAAGRFVELPSLHQAGLYRTASLHAAAARMPGTPESAPRIVYRELAEWPVDYDFTLRWFACGHRAFKLPSGSGECVYSWRQHGSNGTRWQGRCSIDALRACKAHYLARALREGGTPCRVQLCSVGLTLEAWARALEIVGVEVVGKLEWNPKRPKPHELSKPAVTAEGKRSYVRLFAYGAAPIRSRVRRALDAEWDEMHDLFAA